MVAGKAHHNWARLFIITGQCSYAVFSVLIDKNWFAVSRWIRSLLLRPFSSENLCFVVEICLKGFYTIVWLESCGRLGSRRPYKWAKHFLFPLEFCCLSLVLVCFCFLWCFCFSSSSSTLIFPSSVKMPCVSEDKH